jgi:GT2 family glycosyltransferase/glycosyltransferase involved in cell wall biosynthesis
MKDSTAPLVSVIMANFNGAAHIAAAVRSVLRQTERSLDLIVSDDGSSDASLEIAAAAAGGDPRLVVLRSDKARTGPAAARNRALAVARGRWVAIVDNDDFIHPERLARLIWSAERDRADLAADDLLVFYEDGSRAPHAHLGGEFARAPRWVSAAEYERSNKLLSGRRALGYLKPVFRRTPASKYDETLRIAEDSDLVLRLLAGGARMRVYPELGYFYRKHAGSISHRLDAAAIDAMDAACGRIDVLGDIELARALKEGAAARANARAFTDVVAALKRRDVGAALGVAVRRPGVLALLKDPIAARLPKLRAAAARDGPPRVALLSRQRIVGATNGSSAYVLSLAQALKDAGFAVDYVGASPKIFGRWAMLRLRADLDVFDRYRLHGGVRVGPMVFSTDPSRWAASALAVIERVLARLGLPSPGWSQKAEYAQGAPLTREDALYVARQVDARTKAVLCDYAFLNPLAAYALAPDAPVITIMHDLMSARVADQAESDVVVLSAAEEFRLLNMADIVLAIQAEEAENVRAKAAAHVEVILTPHAVSPVAAADSGRDDTLFFVGSNTAPNWVGLEWFFREVWPAVLAARPDARLNVAGSVARGLEGAPEGVELLGVVDDLAPLYRDAGVVISPLRSGSGLKIKLIEAWAAGKAVVGTTVTAQGVEALAGEAMIVADDPLEFAQAVIRLLADASERRALGGKGLNAARERFSAQAAMAAFVARVRSAAGEGPPTLRDEAGQRHERADQHEGDGRLEAHLADQQPG